MLLIANVLDLPHCSALMSWLGVTRPSDGRRAYTGINAYSSDFFDRHLRGRPAKLLGRPASPYPEVLFESRRGGWIGKVVAQPEPASTSTAYCDTSVSLPPLSLKWNLALTGLDHRSLSFSSRWNVGTSTVTIAA